MPANRSCIVTDQSNPQPFITRLMAIIYPRSAPRIETEGARFSILPQEFPPRVRRTVRVGTYNPREPGPLGGTAWSRDSSGAYQELSVWMVAEAIVRQHAVDVPCHSATVEQLHVLDQTLALVPPDHLERVVREKPEGFHLVDAAGRGGSRRYTGGLNPAYDDPSTAFDERRAILITYGAWWHYRDRCPGICPTVLHEIGHVMTHGNNGLSYASFDDERTTLLRGTRASRNPGALEALCNAYMYFLCYGAEDAVVRNFGTAERDPQRDRRTRDALRRAAAFTRLLPEWRSRYDER